MNKKIGKTIIIYINYLKKSLKEIFVKPLYWVIALLSTATLLVIVIWLPNFNFIGTTVFSDFFTFKQKFNILISSLGAFQTNFTATSRTFSLIISLLVGVNVAMLVRYFSTRMASQRAVGASAFGMAVSLLGVGCSACGSVIISSLVGISAAGVLINFLPLNGVEFNLVSIVIIVSSIMYIAKKLQTPNVCAIKVKTRMSWFSRKN